MFIGVNTVLDQGVDFMDLENMYTYEKLLQYLALGLDQSSQNTNNNENEYFYSIESIHISKRNKLHP